VGINGPGVGSFNPAGQVFGGWRSSSPQAEGPVDMEPRVVSRADVGDRLESIECARGHVSGLGAHDRGSVCLGTHVAERLGIHPGLVVSGDTDGRVASEPQ
jgi:hypothetical protein